MSFNPSTAISVLNGIGPLAIKEAKYVYQVPEEVHGLLAELKFMVLLLQDLDGQQQGNHDSQLRILSSEIRDLAFRCEDIVDTYFLKFHEKIENKNFILKFISMVCNWYPIHEIGNQIESIKKNVEATNRRLNMLRLVHNTPIASSSDNVERLRDTPGKVLVAKEGFVVGLNEDIKILADKLCADECSQLSFLAIVGTGGAGKTTLMRKIYDLPAVKNHFPTRALVCVSQQWSGKWLLIEILRQLKVNVEQQSTKPALVEKLQEVLTDKRSLIVLDDIWNRDAWDDISDAFPNFNSGSKILLTTRNSDLLSSINPLPSRNFIHTLKPLDQKEKYHLIHKIALEGREVANIKEFESLTEEMSRKCSGTPLAVVSLAGVLSTKDQLYQWERIKNTMAANILKGKGTNNYGSVEEMLFLSYRDLPPNLRSCMIYLGIYPEDYVIRTEELIRLWISEDLVTIGDYQDLEETIEDVGARFLDELVKRCLLIPIERNYEGELESFQVHDLIRDFCIQKAKEESFFDIMSTSNNWTPAQNNKVQARRIIIHTTREIDSENTMVLLLPTIDVRYSDLATMRSLIQLNPTYDIHPSLADATTLRSILKSFKLLKVLHFYGINGLDLPNEIGDLINLNYLSVHCCQLERPYIPDSIKNLRNLVTFDFLPILRPFTRSPSYLTKVEDERRRSNNFFEKMEKLRYVLISDIPILGPRVNNLKLGKSKSLQVLICDVEGIEMVEDLAALGSLRKLHLNNISSQPQIEAVYKCPSLNCLQNLHLEAYRPSRSWTLDLQNLKHCSVLRKLCVKGISIIEEAEMSQNGGTSPIQFPQNLVSLYLERTFLRKKESITAISKLPRLKHLRLSHCAYTGQQLVMEPNSYLQLETLSLHLDAKEWRFKHEEGDEKDKVILPCLRKLIVNDVEDRLQSLLEELQYMSTLQELKVVARDTLLDRLEVGGEDHHIVKHIPLVSLLLRAPSRLFSHRHRKSRSHLSTSSLRFGSYSVTRVSTNLNTARHFDSHFHKCAHLLRAFIEDI